MSGMRSFDPGGGPHDITAMLWGLVAVLATAALITAVIAFIEALT